MAEPKAATKANAARKAEADDETTAIVEWRGHKFTVPRKYDDWSVDFVESLEEGKSVGIVRGALGPAQWATVRQMNLKILELDDLAGGIAQALGFASSGE